MKEKPATVFVVDDDEAVRTSLRLLLKSVGLPVETRTFEIVNPWEPERSGPRVVPFQFNRIHDEMESLWPEAQLDPSSETPLTSWRSP